MIGVYPSRSIPLTNPFSGVANQPFTYRPSIQWTSEEPRLQSINSKAAIIALFGPNRYRHPQFPRFLGASLSADYWWPIVWQAAQIMSSTVFCSSCHRDRWRGVLDNFLPTTLWTLSWFQWKWFLFCDNIRNLCLIENRSNTTFQFFCSFLDCLPKCFFLRQKHHFLQPNQYSIVLVSWEIILMNLLISNFLSCLQWQWVPSKAVAPSAVFAYLGLSGDICLHYQPSPLFPYVRLTTYRREPKCSSEAKKIWYWKGLN